jgi:hypothetical protein
MSQTCDREKQFAWEEQHDPTHINMREVDKTKRRIDVSGIQSPRTTYRLCRLGLGYPVSTLDRKTPAKKRNKHQPITTKFKPTEIPKIVSAAPKERTDMLRRN